MRLKMFGLPRKDLKWKREPLPADAFRGKNAAVIGGTNGIGRALARALASKGADVLVVGRTFRDVGVPGLRFVQADLATVKEARRLARQLPAETLDLLILTTGIMAGKKRVTNAEGIELDMAVSYLSRFVILREIAARLGASRSGKPKPRVFVMGFPGSDQKGDLDDFNSEARYSLVAAHSNTVIGNEALVVDCATRYPNANFYGLNPGIIKSGIISGVLGEGTLQFKLQQLIVGALLQSTDEYAAKILPLMASPDIEDHPGAMFGRHGDAIHASRAVAQKAHLQRVFEESEKLVRKAIGQEVR
jgi:NAD(P)-dependent dehydrogenase (short-subunit alcohol dehydrogenase family)